MTKRFMILIVILMMVVTFSCKSRENTQPSVYISTVKGSDRNAGTKDKPVRSLKKAGELKAKWQSKNVKSKETFCIYIEGTLDKSDLEFRHILINAKTEGYNGGAIFDFGGQECDGFTLEDNDRLDMKNVTIRNAQTGIRIWDSTGGYYNDYATHVILDHCTIENCTESGIIVGPDSYAVLTDCTLQNNSTESSGGGIWANNASLTLTRCTFLNNTAEKNGGAVSMEHASDKNFKGYIIDGCTFSGNNAKNGYGGAIFTSDDSFTPLNYTVTMKNSIIENNEGCYCGGVVVNYGLTLVTENCIVRNNTATLDYGAVFNYGTIKGEFKFGDNKPENISEIKL